MTEIVTLPVAGSPTWETKAMRRILQLPGPDSSVIATGATRCGAYAGRPCRQPRGARPNRDWGSFKR